MENQAVQNGPAVDRLFSQAYEELRRLASVVSRLNGARTLNPTALVNEAWIKMASAHEIDFQDPLHFKRIAARAMRQIMIEHARRKMARKRGGEEANCFVTFDDRRRRHFP